MCWFDCFMTKDEPVEVKVDVYVESKDEIIDPNLIHKGDLETAQILADLREKVVCKNNTGLRIDVEKTYQTTYTEK